MTSFGQKAASYLSTSHHRNFIKSLSRGIHLELCRHSGYDLKIFKDIFLQSGVLGDLISAL